MYYRDTWLDIDLDAYKANLELYRKNTNKKLILILKANAYGHGDIMMAKYAQKLGYDFFGVSSLDEAMHLRLNGISGEILILGYTAAEYASVAKEHNITLCVPSLDFVKDLPTIEDLKVQIKLDTGMSRIGLRSEEELKDAIELLEAKKVKITGVFSHYACSDCADEKYSQIQFLKFKELIQSCNYKFPLIHIANTDGIEKMPEDFSNTMRLGLGAYGYSSFVTLHPCLSLYTKIAMIKKIEPGTLVSYGCHYEANESEWLATLPIGYADGFWRKNTGRKVYVNGEYGKIVGSVCMDQMMVVLPHYYPENTTVELIGEHLNLKEMASELDTIPYEILVALTDRITRVYTENSQIVLTDNQRFPKL